MNASQGLIEKAKACKSAEELIALAKENGIDLSFEDAELFLQELAEGELTDEELDNVAGGQDGCRKKKTYEFKCWGNREDVTFIANKGEIRQACCVACSYHTITARVEDVSIVYQELSYNDVYLLKKVSGKGAFINGWKRRDEIEKP